ncbi:uncharacterized protein LOC144124546 [Amblyomma americanum]
MDETVDDENVSFEMLIDSMQQEPPSPADDEWSMTQAAVSEPPSPPPYDSGCQPSALPSPSSPLPAAPSTDHRLQTAPPNSEATEHHHQTPPPNSHQAAKPSRHATQESVTRPCQHKSQVVRRPQKKPERRNRVEENGDGNSPGINSH